MSMPLTAWFFIFELIGLTLVIWLPYLWPPVGYHLRRSEGPWLINFDRTCRTKVVLRDFLYTTGFWFGLFLIRISANTPYFWLIVVIGTCSIFGSAFISDSIENYNKSTPAITLFSAVELTPETLRAFLASIGALIPGKQQPYIGRLSYSGGYVWINNPTAVFAKVQKGFLQRHNQERAQYEEYLTKLRACLGSEVRTILFISVLKARNVQAGERAAIIYPAILT
ncbi:MAG: hypothetical protein IPP13_03460 [Kouleothrix sp.]|nr:hypothetical protein [Kouleothrix sp.]